MMSFEELSRLADKIGFTTYAPLDAATIELKSEVRDMCGANACGQYGKNWSCPPGCGTLEECARSLEGFTGGILVQTVGDVEDAYDFEAMMEAEQVHKERFRDMYAVLREAGVPVLALGAGCCGRCKVCTYPDQPCRFPEEMTSSMEAYGMLVTQVCKDNGLAYYYGPDKIAYTSCFLLRNSLTK